MFGTEIMRVFWKLFASAVTTLGGKIRVPAAREAGFFYFYIVLFLYCFYNVHIKY